MTLLLNVLVMLMGFALLVLGGDTGLWVVGAAMVVLSASLMGPAYHESQRERR